MILSGVLIFFWIVLGMFGESDNASLYKKIKFSPVQQGKKGLRKHQSKYDNQGKNYILFFLILNKSHHLAIPYQVTT